MQKSYLLSLMLGMFLVITSCSKDDPIIPNEEELITTVKMKFTPLGGGNAIEFVFTDLDGDGGNAAEITTSALSNNTSYTADIQMLNEAEDPAEDITEEVAMEDLDHQFFYSTSQNLNLSWSYGDQDSEGNPLGLIINVETGEASNGTLTITLKHEPEKEAAGVSDGIIDNAGGETDIQVTFPVEII